MADEAARIETEKQVLLDAVVKAGQVNPVSPNEVLELFIRMECARQGISRLEFRCFPSSDVVTQLVEDPAY